MKLNFRKMLGSGAIIAGLAAAPNLHANVEVFFAGGNATQNVLYDRVTNILTGGVSALTISPTNATVRTYSGTITAQPGLGTVTIDFSLLGAVGGFQDLANQNNENTALSNSLAPTIVVSSASPEAIAIDPTPFVQSFDLAVPYAFIKNPAKSPNLASVTNLTQRQAAYLEGAAGYLPASFFGGTGTNPVYLVPRNTASAVRTETDLNIYFTGTISAWTTNSSLQPIPDSNGGQSSGSAVRGIVNVLTNAIGTVAAQDISTETTLNYEGVPFSITNVENGSYPLWGYDRWAYLKNGQNGAPSANQLLVINALLSAVTNATYQTTSPVFVGNYVPLSGLQVDRSSDGGPIFIP